jgi:hypothetical protein
MDPAISGAAPVTPARLVVLTTELAGNEFNLDRASLVIGRTNENDVVLNHRSISRHHAKIVQDRDHFTIVDLQSANGVRVNGEDYERIELHAGDVVELGHVRIRFVGPAEHYVFDPLSRSNRGRSKVVFALVGVGLAAAIGLVFQRALATHDDGGASALAARPAAPPPPVAPPGAVVAPPPAAPAGSGGDDLLALAASQAKSESWDTSLGTLERLNAVIAAAPPTDASAALHKQAVDLRQQIELERRNAIAFAKFEESAEQKNYAAAIDWYGELGEDSVYKGRARPHFEEARTVLVAQYLAASEKLRQVGKCADLRQEVDLIDKLDPHNSAAAEKLRQCRPKLDGAVTVAASARVAAPAPSRHAATIVAGDAGKRVASTENTPLAPTKRVAETAAAAGGDTDADSLLKQARDAWLHQQCGSAIDLSRKAIRARPGMVDAYQVIAVCSCSLKDAEGATRAYTKLDDKSRTLVRTLCQRNGITVSTE